MKDFFSKCDQILNGKDFLCSEDSDVAQYLNSFFSSTITNLKIPEYTDIKEAVVQRCSV